MDRLILALALALVVAAIAVIVGRRRSPDAPTQRRFSVPDQLDRADFRRPDAPWLVVVFSSSTCDVCRSVSGAARVLESVAVAVADAEFGVDRALHERYAIDAVPTTVVADERGVVVASFLGAVTATDLWAAVAEARQPGSTPGACGPE